MKRWMSLFLAAVMLFSAIPLNALATEVTADAVVSLSVATLPDKVKYMPGETPDLTGLTATAEYSSGAVKTLTAEELTVDAPEVLESGNQTVTLSYEGQTASFEIHVHTVQILEAVEPTYTETGLTEGAVCADPDCGEILQPQEVLSVKAAPELGTPKISVSVADDGVAISWNAVEYAESYQIYRKSGGEWTLLDTVTGTGYLDDAVPMGVSVSYTVRACLQTAEGLASGGDAAEKSVFFVDAKVLNIAGGVSVQWNGVEGAAYYRVYRRAIGGSWEAISSKMPELSFLDEDVEIGVSYEYAVRAYVNGEFTNYHYNLDIIRLEQPKVTASNAYNGIELSWNETEAAKSYNVYRKTGSGSWVRLANVARTSYLDKTAAGEVSYMVRAKNGSTLSSNKLKVTILRLAEPDVTAYNSTAGVTVKWIAVAGADSYRVYRKLPGEKWTRIKSGLTDLSYVDETAQPGVTYLYAVRDWNTTGGSNYASSAKLLRLEQPEAAVANNGVGVKITWNEVAGAESYNVYRKTGSGSWKLLSNETDTSYTDASAESGTTYSYQVRAKTGTTLSGNKQKVTILRLSRPEATVSNVYTGVSVKWEAVTGAASYRVYRKVPDGSWKTLATGVAATQYTDTTAKSGVTYVYLVRAYGGDDYSSAISTDAIEHLARPVASAKTLSTTSVKVTWGAVEGAETYILYVMSGDSEWQTLYTGAAAEYTAEDLTFGVTYSFRVRAVGANDRSARSATVTAKATYLAPDYTVELEPGEGIKISWTAVEGAGSYRVYRRTKGGSWTTLKTTTSSSYVDTTGKPGATYEYAVRAFELAGAEGVSGIRATGKTIVYSKIDPDKPMVALTFDDGPSQYTAAILDQLEKYGGHATFFVVGNRVSSYAKTIKRAYDMGCEIGNHSWDHPALSSISVSAMKSQISRTDAAIKKVIGVAPTLLRPPYGAVDSAVKKYAGKPLIHWSIDTRDWEHRNSSRTISSVMNNVRDGSIILMHDIYAATRTAAVSLIPKLIKKGYQLVTVSELAAYRDVNLKDGKIYYSIYP